MDRVEDLPGDEAVAAAPSDLAEAVERQHRKQEVEPEMSVEVLRGEDGEVEQRPAHLEAVDADEPGTRRATVAHDPGVGDTVGGVGEPALATGLLRVRLVLALEAQVLVVGAPDAPPDDLRRLERRWHPMVFDRLLEPASGLEDVQRLHHLGGDPFLVGARGQRERDAHGCQ
jgi:hypothetical protein